MEFIPHANQFAWNDLHATIITSTYSNPLSSSPEQPDTLTSDEKESPTAPSFGSLAKRIRSRTTDLLAIAVILVGGFAVGSQVSRLWDDEPNPVPTGKTTGRPTLFDSNEPVELDFGNSPFSIQRTAFAGTREDASVELVAKCGRAAESATGPAHAMTPGERRLLQTLAKAEPVAEHDGRKLYRINGPIIMASVTGRVATNGDSKRAVAETRVICWGLAFPVGEKRWIMYVFTPRREGRSAGNSMEIPLPESATPVLTIRGGYGLTRSFRSTESVDAVRTYFEKWFQTNGWINRRTDSAKSTMIYEKSNNDGIHRVELRLNDQSRRATSGLLILTSHPKQQ